MPDRAPVISIVLPVRNAASTLPVALQSIFAQTCADWELIAIEDGSRDDSPGLLREAAEIEPRCRVVTQPPLGIVEALRRGCAEARGRFIARMDADDWMAPDRLARQLDFLGGHPEIGLVSCLVRHGGDSSSQAGYAAHVAWVNSLLTPEQISLRRFVEAPVAHPSVLFRRELLERHDGYASGDFPEDYELWLRWMDAGVSFGKVGAELLTWNDPPGRLSRTEPRYGTEAFYRLKCVWLARWIRQHVAPSRQVWLWGAGRVTRRRFEALEAEGIQLTGFIDVDPDKVRGGRLARPVIGPDQLPEKQLAFILSGVSSRGAREFIAGELNRRGWSEGRDYLLAA